MKRYLMAGLYIIWSLIRFFLIKLFHWNNFNFTIFNLFSPNASIEIARNAKISMGKKLSVKSGTKIYARSSGKIEIGNNVGFNHNCIIASYSNIKIGNNTIFGPAVLVYDHDHDFRNKDWRSNNTLKSSPIIIGENVWIGANSVILRGTTIGDNCVIGAGCVIKGEFPANSLILQKRETDIKHIEINKEG